MSMFTRAISYWPLPICLDLWTWYSRFFCNTALYSIGPCFYHQSHPQLGIVFALAPSPFFLELFLHWSPVAYWPPTDLGSSSFSVLSFYIFILFMEFLRQEYWSGLPFPSAVDHILSEYFQQYMNHELPDTQAGFRKGRRTRDQIPNIH